MASPDSNGTSWVAATITLIVICAQMAMRPAVFVPAGMVAGVAFTVGAHGGHVRGVPDADILITLTIQAVACAAAFAAFGRSDRQATRNFGRLQVELRRADAEAALRADELAALRLLHNGPLTTLTMAAGASGPASPLLRRRAAADLEELPLLAADRQPGVRGQTSLTTRLAATTADYAPLLRVETVLAPSAVPDHVAAAFADATSECLENVVRHAGCADATVRLADDGALVAVEVADAGRGFDPADTAETRFGLRQAVRGRMTTIGGSVRVDSAVGHGTTIRLEWRRG